MINIIPGYDFSLFYIIYGEGTFIGGHYGGYIEFFITFLLSWFSASLGLAKCLKNGVARPIGDGGICLRYLLDFFACGLCLGTRGACLMFATAVRNH